MRGAIHDSIEILFDSLDKSSSRSLSDFKSKGRSLSLSRNVSLLLLLLLSLPWNFVFSKFFF